MKLSAYLTLLAVSILPLSLHAEQMDKTTDSEAMEVITVSYRAPLDYALYQYTTELLNQFRIQIEADIYTQARSGSLKMAKYQSDMTAWNTPYTPITIDNKWVRSE